MSQRIILVLATLFLIALGLAWYLPDNLDFPIFQALRSVAHPFIDVIYDRIADLGNGFLIASVTLSLTGYAHWAGRIQLKTVALGCFSAYVAAGVAAQFFKHLFGRPRAHLIFEPTAHWGPSFERGFDAFPSGHATTAFALAAVLSHYYPRWNIAFYCLAVLLACVRVLRGAHFLTDVIAGAALGTLVGLWIVSIKSRKPSGNQGESDSPLR